MATIDTVGEAAGVVDCAGKSTREINLAMHRGEVNATCGMLTSTVKTQFLDDVTSGRLKLVIQMGNKRSDEFGPVPSVFDYAKSDAEKAVLDVHFGQLLLGRPLAGPPEIPPDRLKALRAAFLATMQDQDFLADAARVGLEIDPASAEEVHDLLNSWGVAWWPGADDVLRVATPQGTKPVWYGDWVVRGTVGEVWPVRDEVFQRSYVESDGPPRV